MHESSFSYTLSKPYPFRWFTPVVVVGGLIVTVLFSFLNVASSGYVLVSEYSTNPNSTTSQGGWFAKWPTLKDRLNPECTSTAIPINTQLYTNNTALQYTLKGVQVDGAETVSLPSLVYGNNPLLDCTIVAIHMHFEQLGRTANQMAMRGWGLEVNGDVMCQVHTPDGIMNVSLASNYNFFPSTVSTLAGQYRFPGRNATDAASLWWGESLLSFNYLSLITVFTEAIGDQSKMSLYITKNEPTTSDLSALNYFSVNERDVTIYPNPDLTKLNSTAEDLSNRHDQITQYSDPGSSGLPGLVYRIGWIRDEYSSFPSLVQNTKGPNIWPIVDALSKVYESTILTDLGQVAARPNLLLNETLLQLYTSNISVLSTEMEGLQDVGPATADFDSTKDDMGPLVVHPSTLATTYLCHVPKRKPTGDLVVSVLVADLVFLQATWLIFTFILGQWMKRKDQSTNYCLKCEACQGALHSVPEKNDDTEQQASESKPFLATTRVDVAAGTDAATPVP